MCGFAGVWDGRGAPPETLAATGRRMAAPLAHRGPDDEGVWTDPAAGVAFGFRRLAILDRSPAGHQPMSSADGRFVLVFNGEIYNFPELRRELEAHGHAFRSTSDTEVILAAAVQWGIEAALPRLWGMFALAIWDVAERRLVLARDRLGKKPVYYTSRDRLFLFGSELSALRAHGDCTLAVDRGALAEYFRFGYVPAPFTIYEHVRKLPPGTFLSLRPGQPPRLGTYWSALDVARAGQSAPSRLSDAEAIDALDALLRDAVSRRLISDVPLGAFLSGGIDSSTVVALMNQAATGPVRTFTIASASAAHDESAHAEAVARHLGTLHTCLRVGDEEARTFVPGLPLVHDEPFADSSLLPTLLVSRLARGGVTVALTGDGGDEVFGGYTRHVWAAAMARTRRYAPAVVRRAAARAIERRAPARWDAAFGALARVVPRRLVPRRPGEKLHKLARALGSERAIDAHVQAASLWHDPRVLVPDAPARVSWARTQADAFGSDDAQRVSMFMDLAGYLPDDILSKLDRGTMALSLEGRAPLLDHRVVEWAARLPTSLLLRRSGEGKWLLRQVLARYVPARLWSRPKSGFSVPMGEWLRGPLRDWAGDLLNADALARAGVASAPVTAAWRDHLAGRAEHDARIWSVIAFRIWRDAQERG